MATAGSPTVRRRRLAAELRRLRGTHRTGGEVARALGWSPAKISRYELGQGGFPPHEVEKLLDFYEVAEPRRTQLLDLAADANARGWWEDYSGALTREYMEFIGLEAEAAAALTWQAATIPGLLQTDEYAYQILAAFQDVTREPPSTIEKRVRVRMMRQQVLTERNPPLQLSVVVDESALLRKIGSRELMAAALRHMAEMAELPNVDLRVLPLESDSALMADSFVVFRFSHDGDVVSTENLKSELYIEGDTTYVYRLFYEAFVRVALSPEESRRHIMKTADKIWG